jgi:hypothetical protein
MFDAAYHRLLRVAREQPLSKHVLSVMAVRTWCCLLLAAVSSLAASQFDLAGGAALSKAPPRDQLLQRIKAYRSAKTTTDLQALISLIASRADVSEAAEEAFLKSYDDCADKNHGPRSRAFHVYRKLGFRLAEAFQNPGQLPIEIRRKAIHELLAIEVQDGNYPSEFTFFGRFICGTPLNFDPKLLNRLVASDVSLATELLSRGDFNRKSALIEALLAKAPQVLWRLLPKLVLDQSSVVRARAVRLSGYYSPATVNDILIAAAADPIAAVREAVTYAWDVASPDVQAQLRKKLALDAVEGVRRAAATVPITGRNG